MGGVEVNRVRENERGWDALNENFNSPVRYLVGQASLYAFLSTKTGITQRLGSQGRRT